MGCFNPIPTYANPPFRGIKIAKAVEDGYNITIDWYQAYAQRLDYNVVYNVYYSTNVEDVFDEGIKAVVTSATQTSLTIPDLIPGDVYYFAVRATSFPINDVNLSQLPSVIGFSVYPEGALLENISDTDVVIRVSDVETFPSFGLLQIGGEIIGYSSVDIPNSALISSMMQRGMYGSIAKMHTTDGYDGDGYKDPLVRHFKGFEECNKSTMLEENTFIGLKSYIYTPTDGYKEKTHIVYPNPEPSDCLNENFKKWDYAGYYRTRPGDYINGQIANSYFGGEHFCADGYNSVGGRVRGIGIDDHQNQREEMLLEVYGRPMVLMRRQISGKVSRHYDNHRENTTHRGLDTYGTDMILGYEQFFNPRRSDGRILVRFDPTVEDVERTEMGLENKFKPNAWTLAYPQLKDGDVLVAFNRDGTEEFRYEIINVTRNTTIGGVDGRQIFTAVRVRKTDQLVKFPVIYDTSNFPQELSTSIGMVAGSIPPHIHTVVVNEGVVTLGQINQATSIVQGHNHIVKDGEVCQVLGHSHLIILP